MAEENERWTRFTPGGEQHGEIRIGGHDHPVLSTRAK